VPGQSWRGVGERDPSHGMDLVCVASAWSQRLLHMWGGGWADWTQSGNLDILLAPMRAVSSGSSEKHSKAGPRAASGAG
jgi:hypothetical protein